ncbi:hypothetical protein [Burkholderia stagnalis]|uniref:Uncharacterized protein n=1 Tax=Burkholderia stagnalis TaxID=1503054 RepID=A0A119H4D9_9BURK|nr:hypothetical protein [Burkholderia stagnalis]KVZ16267.1 hypothetical protein WT35_08685 [Burkholderia stagnalis]KWA43678.1 hypothetical protein WT42_31670 [Burkholderia stagnalis]KWA63804.1 hypothetical protein WT43_08675 [Burkholderia stagnalis]KWA66462.1 hypothetical protein WT44_05200 [Burkholderia stagnalis]KWC96947.1 hypothetical protein WT45_20810 [Burkholderia stagnalis]
MQLILAALLGAAAILPPLAHATTTLSDPADAAAPVPAHAVPSAFDGYRPYRDGDGPGWQHLNRAVTEPARRAATPGKPADSSHANHATHEGPAR